MSSQDISGSPAPPPLNLLLIPFPYRISGLCFEAGPTCMTPPCNEENEKFRFFKIKQKWLENDGRRIRAAEFCKFVVQLVQLAREEVGTVHGIILPETALSEELAVSAATALAKALPGLELFITGVLNSTGREVARNAVHTFIFRDGSVYTEWQQSKHHRWKLDRFQISTYNLGDRLDPNCLWWEHSDVSNRSCTFYVVRYGICLATLICEDLARIETRFKQY